MPRFTSRTLLALGFALVIWASAFAGIRALRRRTVTFPARRALGGDWRSALSRDFSRSACLRSVGVCAVARRGRKDDHAAVRDFCAGDRNRLDLAERSAQAALLGGRPDCAWRRRAGEHAGQGKASSGRHAARHGCHKLSAALQSIRGFHLAASSRASESDRIVRDEHHRVAHIHRLL